MLFKFNREHKLKVDRFEFKNKIRRFLNLKPVIPYIEIHLVDHCNLNCLGCGHFSQIADKYFIDLAIFNRDLKRLSHLVSTVNIIRLLGGEPLLHPDINTLIGEARKIFPKANLRIVSNGILLQSMSSLFWETCQLNRVAIDLTIYPPFVNKKETWINLVKKHNLEVTSSTVSKFFDFVNTKGDSEQEISFKMCRKWLYCPMLREGKIFICAMPALADYYNSECNLQIPNKDYLDIHSKETDGWGILSKINTSAEACKYCTAGWKNPPTFPWTQAPSKKLVNRSAATYSHVQH